MEYLVAHTVVAVFIALLSQESFKTTWEYTLQNVANQFLISIYLMPTIFERHIPYTDIAGFSSFVMFPLLDQFLNLTSHFNTFGLGLG